MKETIRPVSYVKAHTAELLEQVNQTREAVVVTQNGEPRAVVQDVESFEQARKALMLLKLAAQGEAELRSDRGIPQDEVLAILKKRSGRA